MLIFTDRNFNTLALAGTKDIPLLDDELNENIETGTAILKASIPKNHEDVMRIEVGNYVFATDYKKETVALEVMEISETRHEKEIIAEDAGLDLLNDEAGPVNMKGTLSEFIDETIGSTSSWEIGLDEIGKDKSITLEYTGIATQTKRIVQIAGRFGAEVSYSFEFDGNTVARKLINFHKRRGQETGQRIEIAKELEDVKRHISITDLCTAVRPIGKDTQKVVKVVVPWNLLNDSNRVSTTKNYKVGQWTLSEPIKAGEEVTITFKGVIGVGQRFAVYNSGSNYRIGFLEEQEEEGIYSGRFTWSIGAEGNTSLWAYQYPDKSPNNETCKVEWAVITRENQVATKHLPSKPDTVVATAPDPEPTTSSGVPEQTQYVYNTSTKIEKLIAWYEARIGKSGYDQKRRHGPYYYDCSSGLSYAARHAGFMPDSVGLPTTSKLWTYGHAGTYFYQISKSEVRRGDLFVSRSALSASSGTGHTGVFLDNHKNIIHVSTSGGQKGAFKSPATATWLGPGVRYFRWNELKNNPNPPATTKGTAAGSYWTNSEIIHHDLGKSLQGITADQLNNWIRAKSPYSPFNGQGAVFLEAQKQSGLDARYILAHAAHESAWGTSNIARNLHNYFGINAVDSDPYNGAKKSQNAGFKEGIINGAKWVASRYYNSNYKQTTLYKMRWNNGVHEYASDTAWHTKIANIMKGSETYTKKAAVVSTSVATSSTKTVPGQLVSVPNIKYEDQTVDVATTLVGYNYDDGRYVVNPAGEICDKEGLERWGRFKGVGTETTGYILRVYESEAQTPKALFQEGLRFLQNNNEPKVNYEIDLSHLPDGIELGDTVRIVDHEFQPPLYLDARVIDITISSTDRKMNKAIFSNFVERGSGILDRIMALQDMAKSFKWDWDSQPYDMHISSSSGNVFKDGIISTDLIANVTKAGVDQTSMVDSFIWERVSAYQDKLNKSDDAWNDEALASRGNVKNISADDVDLEATFTCQAFKDDVVVAGAAYTIKDLTIGQYKQDEEPDVTQLNWGDIWQSKDADPPFKKIWKGDVWEDVIVRRDIDVAKEEVKEEIELNIGEAIDTKLDTAMGDTVAKVEALEVHLQQYPPAESITKTAIDVEKTNAYLEALKTAIESDALTLQDRLAIIEANVGAGKLSIEAITTYFEFGEEGVLIGKQDEQVKLNLSNNALEIIDGDKVVARFANNQTETPNLRVSGVFEFGYHMATKIEKDGRKFTVIRPV